MSVCRSCDAEIEWIKLRPECPRCILCTDTDSPAEGLGCQDWRNNMKRLLVTIAVIAMITAAAPALAEEVVLEAGVTFFNNGTCTERDGTSGLSSADGECVTAADYDAMFSYEALTQVESQIPAYAGRSVADVYSITPDVASERLIGVGLVEVLFTFAGLVEPGVYHTPDGVVLVTVGGQVAS